MNTELEHRQAEIDLLSLTRNFVQLLLKYWCLPVLLALVCGVVSYGYTWKNYTPLYRAEVSMTVMVDSTGSGESYDFSYDNSAASQLTNIFPYILNSVLMTDALKEELGQDTLAGSLSVTMVENSNLLTLSATSQDPVAAKELLEAAVHVYPQVARVVIGDIAFHRISVPEVPTQPYNFPNYLHSVELGALVGAALGCMILGAFALISRKVQRPEQLSPVCSLPCLGKISVIRHRKAEYPSIYTQGLSSSFSDELDGVVLAIQRELQDCQGKVLLVTSTLEGEGKSTVSENLAYSLAREGKRVLLVDADLRKQDLWTRVGATGAFGLWEVVQEKYPVPKALEECKPGEILFLGGRNPVPSVPIVLNDPQLGKVIHQLQGMVDVVILDTPPALSFEDAGLLATYADGVICVVRHNWLTRRQILETVDLMTDIGAKLIGFVYNGVARGRSGYGYGYGYGKYGYGSYGYKRGGYQTHSENQG